MNTSRRGFLKALGIGIVGAVLAPKIEIFLEQVGPVVNSTSVVELSYDDLAGQLAILKELYNGSIIKDLIDKDNPFLALVRRDDILVGEYLPVKYG